MLSLKNTPAFIKARRRSVGNVSIFQLLNYSSGGLNQSNLNESLTHKEKINGLNLKKTNSMVGNDMSATDLEYLKFL